MGKHHHHHHYSERLFLPDIRSMNYKSQKRLKELYYITNEILNQFDEMNSKYDSKLYRKYKQLKQINKKLQEKIINQHCSGCKCHENLDTSISIIDSKSSIDKENQNQEDDENEEEPIDTNVQTIEKENEDDDGFSKLPVLLQEVIKDKVENSKTNMKYLLKIGLYPTLCAFLCDTSIDSLRRKEIQSAISPFVKTNLKYKQKSYMTMFRRVTEEMCDIHHSYVVKYLKNQQKDNKANCKKVH